MTERTRNQKLVRRAITTLMMAVVAVLVFTRIAGGNVVPRVAEGPAQLQGLTVRYALPGGEYVQRTFVSEAEARWKILSGPREGDEGTETITLKPVAPGIFFVNRVDLVRGETVSEVFNLATLTVSVYITRPNPDDPLRRMERFGDGRIEIVSAALDGSRRGIAAARSGLA